MISRLRQTVARARGLLGLASRQLASARGRLLLAVLGVAVAVLLVTLMAGLGYGVTQAGTDALGYIDQDVWASAGPLQLAPGRVGGVENSLVDAHGEAAAIEADPGVETAEALAFQSVYIGVDSEEFDTVVGVGVTGNGSGVGLGGSEGVFERSDIHYANGSYDGPMTNAVVLNTALADRLNVSTGDTVHLGGTVLDARQNEFTVVAISGRFSVFLGAPTAVVHLSELQTVAGTSGSDRGSLVGVRLAPDADTDATLQRLRDDHEQLTFRTQRQQFRSVFEDQGAVLASVVTLVVLAVTIGVALVANTLGLVVYQQRAALSALRALGFRARSLVLTVVLQGLVVSVAGVTLGLLTAPVVAGGINNVVKGLVGFANLIKLPATVFVVGAGVGLVIGLVGAAVAGWRVSATNPVANLREQ